MTCCGSVRRRSASRRTSSPSSFYEAERDTVVESLQPVGQPNDYPPVVASDFLRERLDAISVG